MKSPTKRKTVHYVNNAKLYQEIVEYKKQVELAKQEGREEPRIPNYVGECIYKIATRLATKPIFMNYSFKEEMISDGIENCIMYFHDYNPDYTNANDPEKEYTPNPFAYFTQIIYYAFLRRINKEERNRYIIYKNFQESSYDHNLLKDFDDNNLMPNKLYDNISDFMERFEAKEARKKQKRKEVKEGLMKFYED